MEGAAYVSGNGCGAMRTSAMQSKFDLVVFGASGFTGRLVAEHLHAAGGDKLAWALAGRDEARLAAVRDQIGAGSELPLLLADAGDPKGLKSLVRQARAVISTVGPYQRYGEALVTACAEAGTDYLDLCGEPVWMAAMIPRLEPLARASGARIVFSCGFDSIPFDLGVVALQAAAQERFGAPLSEVHGRVRSIKGGPSGGTVASLLAMIEAMRDDPSLARTMADPFALTPGFRGPAQPGDDNSPAYDELAQSWSGPFVMAPVNTKNVHRTNQLRGHPWGTDFRYDERQLTGDGERGRRRASRMVRLARWQQRLLAFTPTRELLRRLVLPSPGQGPDAGERERGHYELWFFGSGPQGQALRMVVRGDRDPGYGSTSKIVAETALCLLEVDRTMAAGGVWTPGAAMGMLLARRLQERAGLSFTLQG